MIRCPICRKPVEKDNPELPFCSERCRIIDLGNWAMEKYRVPGPPAHGPDDSGDDHGNA